MVVHIPPEEILFFFWIFLLHLSPSLSCQACCFCFVSHRRSEVINYSKGRKHLGGLCYVNNKCSCPQALVQVVNKLVNYIEINAIALDLKLRSPCIGSVSCSSSCVPHLAPKAAAPQATAAAELGACPSQPRCGFQIVPFAPTFLPKAEAQGFGATLGMKVAYGGFGSRGPSAFTCRWGPGADPLIRVALGREGFATRLWHVKHRSVLVASPTFD